MLKRFLRSERLTALQHALQNQDLLLIEELWNAPKALIAALAQQTTNKHILVKSYLNRSEAPIGVKQLSKHEPLLSYKARGFLVRKAKHCLLVPMLLPRLS